MASKVGFVFSGAAALIGQEAALAYALIEGRSRFERSVRPDVMAGTSSGALTAVAVNAILQTKDGASKKPYYWGFDPDRMESNVQPEHSFFDLLANLKDHDVYHINLTGLAKGGVLDNSPLRKLLKRVVEDTLGYRKLGDLYLPTYISVVERATGKTCRFFSRNPRHEDIDLVDLLVASSAIPIVFPPQSIRGVPETEGKLYFDGGTGPDTVPVGALREEHCSEIYLVNRMGSTEEALHKPIYPKHPPKVEDPASVHAPDTIIENTALALEYLFRTAGFAQLRRAMELGETAYIYEPRLSKPYSILDFETEAQQWLDTWNWAVENEPLAIDEGYLLAAWLRRKQI